MFTSTLRGLIIVLLGTLAVAAFAPAQATKSIHGSRLTSDYAPTESLPQGGARN